MPLGVRRIDEEHEHIRNLIAQVLFVSPGERVNQPDFGSGLLQAVFEPINDELYANTQFFVQSALQNALGDKIEVHEVEVSSEDTKLFVKVTYSILKTDEYQTAEFTR
ncbi:MAG: GPW/gp25 family protein [Bacteroidetes bacterium]|nr:GPW/gp25 family protein [Bacteroidota bacterium]